VSDTSGDKIVHRALAPLPELSSIVFFRRAYLDFITGRGPMPERAGKKARAFMRYGMWLFLIGGVVIGLLVGVIEIGRRQSGLDDLDAGWIVAGPVLLFLALIYWLFSWSQARRLAREQRLSHGGLIGGELVKVKYFEGSADGSPASLRVDYRFTAPDGQLVEKRQSLLRFDFSRKNLPPPGSKVLLLYVDAETFEVL
jgi:hypothetical protein